MNVFSVNVADLRRSRAAERTVAMSAAVDWALELSAVEPAPNGADNLDLVLTLTPVGGGLLVHGSAEMVVRHSCHRCLEEWTEPITVPISAMFTADGAQDDETFPLGDVIDLEPAVRDDVLTAMPMSPTCPNGCSGQLVGDGEMGLNTRTPAEPRSADGDPDVREMEEASPFSVLKDLLKPGD